MSRPLRVAVEHACRSTRDVLCAELAAHPRLQVVAGHPGEPAADVAEPADVVLAQPGTGAAPAEPDLILLAAPDHPGPALDAVPARPADRFVDVVVLPEGDPELLRRTVRAELLPALLGLAVARAPITWCTPLPGALDAGADAGTAGASGPDSPFTVLAIGSGRGGLPGLCGLLAALPPDLPVPVVVVQHLPRGYHRELAGRLSRLIGRDGSVTAGGPSLPAPGRIRLVEGTLDGLFRAVARSHGDGVLGLVLGGIGRDGVQGATVVRGCGGTVLGQAGAGSGTGSGMASGLWGMPAAVAAAGQADRLAPLEDLPAALTVTLTRQLAVTPGRHVRNDLVVAGR